MILWPIKSQITIYECSLCKVSARSADECSITSQKKIEKNKNLCKLLSSHSQRSRYVEARGKQSTIVTARGLVKLKATRIYVFLSSYHFLASIILLWTQIFFLSIIFYDSAAYQTSSNYISSRSLQSFSSICLQIFIFKAKEDRKEQKLIDVT